jgi:hypothetical protein
MLQQILNDGLISFMVLAMRVKHCFHFPFSDFARIESRSAARYSRSGAGTARSRVGRGRGVASRSEAVEVALDAGRR